ncbi:MULTISPECIES: ferrous iron transporter B [unclassified Sphingopyxis]|uniref:ferrous iron transporter B n=1 Tax=unclassified Sphingopyxis TaxID=2614943 RepID=UPI0007303BD3|nr:MULTISPECIES: ferrous iron transporter B [unclassified Sphingopyxis]KTE27120.1 ferrous iron transporter B [Sphingopyxis sp. H057]KTE54427.1 ferrous iron transporter B [Sphingopyxis sp. H073]KTE54806.1 ferrous iron transporter B [Sphingopyxis sp. H107]KTE56748.1 ferrous iron transporter B [Sphingopyxis sp. H071]KTE66778.1 ferrous iron transporter B [Sphingopyxis sp. H081]
MTGPIPSIALVGNPNAGKSSLFNALTGARQKIANYPGVTVERKAGHASFADGRPIALIDLPGTYSLTPASLDEAVTRDVVLGKQEGEKRPDALIVVVDAANLDNHLCFALELLALGLPTVVALNMLDLAERDGLTLDPQRLARELGVPVVPTVAVRKRGLADLLEAVDDAIRTHEPREVVPAPRSDASLHQRARALARAATLSETPVRRWTQRVDSIVLHPIGGFALLLALMFVMFQSVYAAAEAPADFLESGIGMLQGWVVDTMPDTFLRGLIVEGVLAGVGAVIVFLPQILILFLFILLLEASGYMARAAFLMDGLMGKVGLSGRGFIPLVSSFACAVPGIMATRAIPDEKDRLTTILIAPLMTCSARMPVYALVIGAFIPARNVGGTPVGLQGLVLFGLFLSGIVGALLVAYVLRRSVTRGNAAGFMMEMPRYQWPRARDIAIALWQRAWIFLRRAGTIIAMTTVVLWLLLSFPKAPVGQSQVEYSVAGRIASGLEVVVKPIGFNHDIALALIPAMAAREVAVSAMATANAIDADGDEAAMAETLGERLQGKWSLATALAFLAWFVFAPQCISTIAITRRETNGWKWPMFMVGYLFLLAYAAAGITYWTAVAFGLG